MKLTTLAVAALGLFSTGTTAVYAVYYPDTDCGGNPTGRNVYSNTCATVAGGFKSFKITAHAPSAAAQRLRWFSGTNCGLASEVGCEGAGPNGYPLQECINVDGADTKPGKALGSSASPCDFP